MSGRGGLTGLQIHTFKLKRNPRLFKKPFFIFISHRAADLPLYPRTRDTGHTSDLSGDSHRCPFREPPRCAHHLRPYHLIIAPSPLFCFLLFSKAGILPQHPGHRVVPSIHLFLEMKLRPLVCLCVIYNASWPSTFWLFIHTSAFSIKMAFITKIICFIQSVLDPYQF